MNNQNLLVHVGYHKTATTWLQNFLFNNQALGFISPFEKHHVVNSLILPHPLDFDPIECKKKYFKILLKTPVKNLVSVVSCEALSGNPHFGGYNSKENAERLAAIFPGVKILIVIREQKNMIYSNFKHYIKVGGICSLKELLTAPAHGNWRAPWFDPDHFKYQRLVAHYISLFGEANVLVLPYELFRIDPHKFIAKIQQFNGLKPTPALINQLPFKTKHNDSLSATVLTLKRKLNSLVIQRTPLNPGVLIPIKNSNSKIVSSLRLLDKLIPKVLTLHLDNKSKKLILDKIGNKYKESNFILNKLTKLDLSTYGYDVGFNSNKTNL